MPVIPAHGEAEAGASHDSRSQIQQGWHGKTPSLLEIQKLDVGTFTEMEPVEHREACHSPAVLKGLKISFYQYVVTDVTKLGK